MVKINSLDRQRWLKFFTHLIVIIMIFFLPEMLFNYTNVHRRPKLESLMYIKAAGFVLIFYINYYLILNKSFFDKKHNYVQLILWNLLLMAAFIGITLLVRQELWGDVKYSEKHHQELSRKIVLIRDWSYILRDIGMIVLTVALSASLRFAENWSSLEKRHERLLASQKTDELQSLKNQLNPHFLFNTLNTIYSLIDISPKEAQEAIHRLSKLLRHVLYENQTMLPLASEIDFTKAYISLMEMRLGDGMVKCDFSHIADPNLEIPPLMFMTIIENALKHGNTGHSGQPIEISISTGTDGVVRCRTFNHFTYKGNDTGNIRQGGIGLSNLRRRLQLIYGADASLKTTVDGDTYTAELIINTRKKQ